MRSGPHPVPAATPAGSPPAHYERADQHPTGARLRALMLAALGVVFGDIGTSPLYTLKETFSEHAGFAPQAPNVYGVLSLILWSLILVVVLKYLTFILRADNRGEGGVLAMLALLLQPARQTVASRRWKRTLVLLGLFGTALLYGDGIITPAISVLGAVEGLTVVAPRFEPFVVAASVVILLVLFLFQRFGTARVGRIFGPITFVWFITIAVLGIAEIARAPQVLAAIDPRWALRFFMSHGITGFTALGGIFLAVTGAEALYADIGHFGTKPIRLTFFLLVLPALALNYFGQGALLLRDPGAITNPFYLLAPRWFLYPLLIIATLAAIVASQALISGAYSLAQQSVQLGYLPRLRIVHTSREEYGQIYVPGVNIALMLGTLAIVVFFRSSSALGAAYGIAVTGTMSITTILFSVIARRQWNWPLPRVLALAAFFLSFDLAFLGANALKIASGGWVPLAIGFGIMILMTTWKTGRELLKDVTQQGRVPLETLIEDLRRKPIVRVPGTAVFLTGDAAGAPAVLMHHLKHNKALHQSVIMLSIRTVGVPAVDGEARTTVIPLELGFVRVTALYGFMETPNIPEIMESCRSRHGLEAPLMQTTFFLNRERLLPTGKGVMMTWRKKLFILMSRNAQPATAFFAIPPNRVVELGAQVEL
jgi:KUP system potassium uptake protein